MSDTQPNEENRSAERSLAGKTGSAPSCLDYKHGLEHFTHLTGCARCRYPRERDPRIVDRSLIRMGAVVVPIGVASFCPHFSQNKNDVPIPAPTQHEKH